MKRMVKRTVLVTDIAPVPVIVESRSVRVCAVETTQVVLIEPESQMVEATVELTKRLDTMQNRANS